MRLGNVPDFTHPQRRERRYGLFCRLVLDDLGDQVEAKRW